MLLLTIINEFFTCLFVSLLVILYLNLIYSVHFICVDMDMSLISEKKYSYLLSYLILLAGYITRSKVLNNETLL